MRVGKQLHGGRCGLSRCHLLKEKELSSSTKQQIHSLSSHKWLDTAQAVHPLFQRFMTTLITILSILCKRLRNSSTSAELLNKVEQVVVANYRLVRLQMHVDSSVVDIIIRSWRNSIDVTDLL